MKMNEILGKMWQNREEATEEFTAMLELYGLLQKALEGALYGMDIIRYNSILASTVVDYRLRRQLTVRQ